MNATTAIAAIAASKNNTRACRVNGILSVGDPVSVLTLRADLTLTDGTRLSDAHIRIFGIAIREVAAAEGLTWVKEGLTDFELTGEVFNTESARRVATLVCGRVLELTPRHLGSTLNFVVSEISVSPPR